MSEETCDEHDHYAIKIRGAVLRQGGSNGPGKLPEPYDQGFRSRVGWFRRIGGTTLVA